MVQCLRSFLDFCYIACRNALDEPAVLELETHLEHFHNLRVVFIHTGVREAISLPRQHGLKHYPRGIRLFGSANGLCSSITESKHIKAVKEPWRRSSHFNALSQMLLINERMDKMAAARLAFQRYGMLEGTTSSYTARILANERPEREPTPPFFDTSDEDEAAVDGIRDTQSVELARTPGTLQ
jgi:hypothetical protein